MDFKVICGDREDHFHGDAQYRIDAHGLLVVSNGMGQQRTYSPSGWDYLDEDQPSGGWVASL